MMIIKKLRVRLALTVAMAICVCAIATAQTTNFYNLAALGTLRVDETATVMGNLNTDAALVLGATTYCNGGIYINVQNKSGATLRVGTITQWDATAIAVTSAVGDSLTMISGVGAVAAQGAGLYQFFAFGAGGAPANDYYFVTGTSQSSAAQAETLLVNGASDTTYGSKLFKTVTGIRAASIAGGATVTLKMAAVMGVVPAAVKADGDSVTIHLYNGVVYPATIADDAWGTILIKGVGKVLVHSMDGIIKPGTPLDVDADSVGIASAAVQTTGNQLLELVGNSLQVMAKYTVVPQAVWAYVNFR